MDCKNYTCGVAGRGKFRKGVDCLHCWNAANIPGVAAALGREPIPARDASPVASKPAKSRQVPPSTFPCVHRGEATGERATCAEGCRKGTALPVLACAVKGKCVVAKTAAEGMQCCRDCLKREGLTNGSEPTATTAEPHAVLPVRPRLRSHDARDSLPARSLSVARTDAMPPTRRIPVTLPGHFNAGLIEHAGRLILATRHAERIYLSVLADDLTYFARLTAAWPMPLTHPLCAAGAEDPRLFLHRGKLHVGFTGVSHANAGRKRSDLRITQLVAELDDDFRAVKIIAPTFPGVQRIEKNWGWFSHDDELHAVYSISPHVVVAFPDDAPPVIHTTPNDLPWSGGYLRGGAPPVRVGDEYACWFHGAEETPEGRVYNVGTYRFDDRTFEITAQSPHPLLWADPATKPKDSPARAAGVVFAAGAVLRGNEWLVSAGVHDSWCEIMTWPK